MVEQTNEKQEKETIEKQNYLIENIINKGYNADEFTNYMWQQKGPNNIENGEKIENWTFEEIKSVEIISKYCILSYLILFLI